MVGNLFSRGYTPTEGLLDLSYCDLKYWNEWHVLMAKEEARIARGK
jgi:hypothetical protein